MSHIPGDASDTEAGSDSDVEAVVPVHGEDGEFLDHAVPGEGGAAAAKEASQTARLRRALVAFDPGSLPAHLALPVMGATLRALAPPPSE